MIKTHPLIPDNYKIHLDEEKIQQIVQRLVEEINGYYRDYYPNESVYLVVVLNGACMFASDMMKLFTFECVVDYIKVKTRQVGREDDGGTGFKVIYDIDHNIEGKCVLVLDEMADTRLTTRGLRKHLSNKGPKDLVFCVAFNKAEAKLFPEEIEFIGRDIPNQWAIGYGLDGKMGSYRNLPFLALKVHD